MKSLSFPGLSSLIFLTNKDITKFSQSKTVFRDLSSFTELSSDPLKDLLPFFANILEVNGISGFPQDN